MILGWTVILVVIVLGTISYLIKDDEFDEWKNDKHK